MKSGKLWMAAGLACLFAATAGAEWQRTVSAWDTRLPAQGKLQLSLWADRFAADSSRCTSSSSTSHLRDRSTQKRSCCADCCAD